MRSKNYNTQSLYALSQDSLVRFPNSKSEKYKASCTRYLFTTLSEDVLKQYSSHIAAFEHASMASCALLGFRQASEEDRKFSYHYSFAFFSLKQLSSINLLF